jgi:hypothetical protein
VRVAGTAATTHLGDFVVMMREPQVHAARVNVQTALRQRLQRVSATHSNTTTHSTGDAASRHEKTRADTSRHERR